MGDAAAEGVLGLVEKEDVSLDVAIVEVEIEPPLITPYFQRALAVKDSNMEREGSTWNSDEE